MRMNGAEAIMWWAEQDPSLRSDFTNVTLLDSTPDFGRLRARLLASLHAIPRLHQRVVAPPVRIQPPEWRDTFVDLDHHLRRVALPDPGDRRTLLDLAAEFASDPLDRSRPLWQFVLVERLEGDRSALLQKVHHSVTDGVGGVRLAMMLLDPLDGSPPPEARITAPPPLGDDDPIERVTPIDALVRAAGDAVREGFTFGRRAVSGAFDVARSPWELPERAGDAVELAASVRRQLLVVEGGRSPLFRRRSLARRFEVLEFDFAALHRSAKRLGVTFNDVFVSAVSAGLGRYHALMGSPVTELRMAMAVDTRTPGTPAGANSFAPTRVLVTTRVDDVAEHVRQIHAELAGARREAVLGAVDFLATLAAPLPTAVIIAAMKNQTATVDFATSNVRGSPIPLSIGGSRIVANFPFGPRTGTPLNVTLFTYDDKAEIACNIDPAAVSDVPRLLDCLTRAFRDVAAYSNREG